MEYDQIPKNHHNSEIKPISEGDLDALIGRIINHVFKGNKPSKPTLIKQYLKHVGALKFELSTKPHKGKQSLEINIKAIYQRLDFLNTRK